MAGHRTGTSIAKAVREARDAGALKELSDPGQQGLWLRITKTGSKTWVLRARDQTGRFRIFVLGHHPGAWVCRRHARQPDSFAFRSGAALTLRRQRRAARTAQNKPSAPLPAAPSRHPAAVLAIYEAQRGNEPQELGAQP